MEKQSASPHQLPEVGAAGDTQVVQGGPPRPRKMVWGASAGELQRRRSAKMRGWTLQPVYQNPRAGAYSIPGSLGEGMTVDLTGKNLEEALRDAPPGGMRRQLQKEYDARPPTGWNWPFKNLKGY